MRHFANPFNDVCLSFADVAGAAYVSAACRGRSFLTGRDPVELARPLEEAFSWFADEFYQRQVELLPMVGERVFTGMASSAHGGTTRAFAEHSHTEPAPLSGLGCYRVGEDGRLYFIAKSEHYHASLGHSFPGYRLIDLARRLGIPNATHNNTRGHLTRLAEEELIRVANGGGAIPSAGGLDCVLNLQTGSLAAEAALKLALARFFPQDGRSAIPVHGGKTPVIVVLGDDDGDLTGNYHGTTLTTQMLRGLWPSYYAAQSSGGIFRVCAVRPNCESDLVRVFEEFGSGDFRIAAFIHEIIMMNYGARKLEPSFLKKAYDLCRQYGAVTIVDEIQSCVWGRGLFSFLEWGLEPDVVVVGKGFPGGEYAGSRVLFRRDLDVLPQFSALVTNGQEELTSLAYLVTIRWVEANQDPIYRIGCQFEEGVREIASCFPDRVLRVEGCRHLVGLVFGAVSDARAFASHVTSGGIDISVQTYKENCPPVALLKLPLVSGPEAVSMILERLSRALKET